MLFILDKGHADLPMSPQQFLQLGSAVSVFGCNRIGFLFKLSLTDSASTGPSSFARCFSQSDLSISPPDFAKLGLTLFLQTVARLEPCLLAFGVCKFDYAQSMSVVNYLVMGSPIPTRSLVCLGSSSFMSDYANPGPSSSLKSLGCIELSLFAIGVSWLGFFLLLFDTPTPEPSPSLRSFACSELPTSMLEISHCGSSTFLQSFARADSLALTTGVARLELISSPSVIESTALDSPSFVRSYVHLGSAVLVLDFLRLDFALSLRSVVRTGLSCFVWGLTRVGFLFSLPLVDYGCMDSPLLFRSSGRLAFLSSALEFVQMDFLFLLRDIGRPGPVLPISRRPVEVSLPLLDFVNSELFPSLQMFSHLGPVTSALKVATPDSSLFLKSFSYLASMVSMVGIACAGLCFLLSVMDDVVLGLFLLVRSLVRLGSALSVVDFFRLGLVSSIRSHSCASSVLLALGIARVDLVSSLLLLDACTIEPFVLIQQFA